ncbi:hypothetical protein B9T28_06365 [Acinetobacter silvestris]|uniref:Uncharacterized protein n=1 Tax=Acinetobacter silvestris TaxID=1977882 RepID=A0A1Y3CFD4_9GAMM|nr:hypothetical protein B9T28_06365 [Acinetobacter silvestris]
MNEFDKWMSTIGLNVIRHANCCRIAFDGGRQSRQVEIDDLQNQLSCCREENKGLLERVNDLNFPR